MLPLGVEVARIIGTRSCKVTNVIYFSQPIQDKEVLAEDEQTFLAKQQVRFFTMKPIIYFTNK